MLVARTLSLQCHGARLNACAEDWVLHIPTVLPELHHEAFLPVFCRRSTPSHSRNSFKAPQPQLSAANLSGEHVSRVKLETMTLDNSGISNVTLENLQEQTAREPEL